ncbi:MAG: hypothetical protein EP302_06805 [Bacteroidetes bacterium]|jgi:uncharacterized membrane protein YgaE (UPF0421/DUF939 family)|nr:MAG: hypothetical protein EP302_06805 [Bacteroidota bacterium]
MLRFFRQLRQRLIIESQFSRYLLYAIGEILLVVIGILIALQVNNWNEERKNDKKVAKYTEGLIADLKKDRRLVVGVLEDCMNDIEEISADKRELASQFNAVLVSRMAHNRVTLTWFEPVLEEIDLLLEELEKN